MMRRAAQLTAGVICACFAVSCASGSPDPGPQREVTLVDVEFEQDVVIHSSILQFRFLGTSSKQATLGSVRLSGSLGDGVELDERIYVPVDRIGDKGDLVVELRVADRLWGVVEPDPARTLSGRIDFELEDEIGVFAAASVEDVVLRFRADFAPRVQPVSNGLDVYPDQMLPLDGEGFVRPEEGNTWAVVDTGSISYEDGSSRPVTNARVPVRWTSRNRARLPMSPAIFGVRPGTFAGDVRFENQLKTGEVFEGNALTGFRADLQLPRVDDITPRSGSRGQKITIEGRGFVGPATDASAGTYFSLSGELAPAGGGSPIRVNDGDLIVSPFRVVSEESVEQDVSYGVNPATRQLTGLGAVPGRFSGTVTPYIYRGSEEQAGEAWSGTFEVLPTLQVVHVKYLPGFSRALSQYGLGEYESAVRERVMEVLERDYTGTNVRFSVVEPDDFVEFTTIEIGGPDPSGLLNFGYDNSFNDGGKDVGNLYLSDYLGGVNRHSQDAGYLPYGGVFIESFIAFSPTLYPDNFGTSPEFDVVLGPFMPALGGTPATVADAEGARATALENAILLMGNLTGHTAAHELGHAFGLAHFPTSVENFDQRFHNDPPGPRLIMDAGSDRPFNERAELNGEGPAEFSSENLDYLKRILPTAP